MNHVFTLRIALATILVTMLCPIKNASAESAVELLSGFDAQRIDDAYPPGNAKTFGELAKMVYRLNRISPKTIAAKVDASTEFGHAFQFEGKIQSMRLLKVPDKLVEFMEFPSFGDFVIELTPGDEDEPDAEPQTLNVISVRLPRGAKVGDGVSGYGVIVEPSNSNESESENKTPRGVVACPLKWFPSEPASPGWQLLSGAGVDVSGLAEMGSRNQQPLSAADNDPFYQILSVAQKIGRSPEAVKVEPKWAEPTSLLKTPKKFAGDWIRMRLQTVRVTRIAVTEPERQQQIGKDHYFQIDASGDLGDGMIRLKRKNEDGQVKETLFDGSYPVSLVVLDLPDFLRTAIRAQEGGDAAAAMISKPVQVEAFFFRLWSYESDKMQREGGGKQIGPLMMVARMTDRTAAVEGGVSANIFGYVAAVFIFSALIAVLVWHRRNSSKDRQVREKQQDRDSNRLNIPSEIR